MAMEKPRAWVVRAEADTNIITCITHAHNISQDGINIVLCVVTCTLNDPEFVLYPRQML